MSVNRVLSMLWGFAGICFWLALGAAWFVTGHLLSVFVLVDASGSYDAGHALAAAVGVTCSMIVLLVARPLVDRFWDAYYRLVDRVQAL